LFTPAPSAAEVERAERAKLIRRVIPVPGSAEVIDGELDPVAYRVLLDHHRVVLENFPLPGSRTVDLQLTSFDVLAAHARLVVVDDGGERELPRSGLRSFRGLVKGEPDSTVTLNAFEGSLAGSIRIRDEAFVITPEEYGPAASAMRSVRIRSRAADPDRPNRPFCSEELPQPTASGVKPGTETMSASAFMIDGNTVLTAQIAIDATYEWFAHFGDLTAAQNYILNLMAQISTIYENEVNIHLEVPYLRVFTVPGDPYSDTTSTSTLLSELRTEWNANQTSIDRTVAHLFSVRPSGGAGRAYIDALCSNVLRPGNSIDYGVSSLSALGGSWEKDLVAHELGHNFSSPHTHCYVPEIDQCATATNCYSGPIVATTGTIMSYCASSISEFHPRVEDERIRPAAEAALSICMTSQDVTPPAPPQGLRVN
jgi:hypothetical protein